MAEQKVRLTKLEVQRILDLFEQPESFQVVDLTFTPTGFSSVVHASINGSAPVDVSDIDSW
jgi:hypothetical protein